MGIALVTVGTDGTVDYVQPPDGVRYMLGSVSLFSFVSALASNKRVAREVLDRVLGEGQAMMSVDLGRMWSLLPARRARWATVRRIANAFVRSLDRTLWNPFGQNLRQGTMADKDITQEAVLKQIASIERQISVLQQKAKEAESGSASALSMAEDIKALKSLVDCLRSPAEGQSKNDAFYGTKTASYNTLQENASIAEHVVSRVAETNVKIDRLAAAGKRFNVARAKGDLHRIASQVQEIAQNVDLAQPWVKKDLAALAKQADDIFGLFPAQD